MPLKVNAGLSRKIGEANYSSRGASIHVELELDSGLIHEPQKLQERIRQLFTLVRSSLAEELSSHGPAQHEGGHHGNGQASGQQAAPRPATALQVKAVHAIAKDKGINVQPIIQAQYGTSKVEQLTVKQASELIDQLRSEGGAE